MPADERLNQDVRLPEGNRRMGFAEYGNYSGFPLFYFHGWPSSRFEPRLLHEPCSRLGIRLIAPERPGYGLSDFQPGRTILDWPAHVCYLADRLGIGRFAVLGVSGGGPYAVACGFSLPKRLTSLLLVCSVGPADSPEAIQGMVALNRWLLTFARRAPWLAAQLGALCIRAAWGKGHQPIPPAVERKLPRLDKLALLNREVRETLTDSSREAFRNGPAAAVADGLLLARSWGFALEKVHAPVHLWHGESDIIVPPGMGRALAGRLPNCQAAFYADDGHFSLLYNRAKEILGKVSFW